MNARSVLLAVFLAVAAGQWVVPLSMIAGRERTLARGESFVFRTRPVDPYDAFRGRYLALSLAETTAPAGAQALEPGQRVYAFLARDPDGYARFAAVSTERPPAGAYLRTRVSWRSGDTVHLRLPFDRFYLDERLAPEAERVYWQHSRGDRHDAALLVRVLRGRAVIEDLHVGGVPILEFVRRSAAPD